METGAFSSGFARDTSCGGGAKENRLINAVRSALSGGRIHQKQKNRHNYREPSKFVVDVIEFCPKSANFTLSQGINREFCGISVSITNRGTYCSLPWNSKKKQGTSRDFCCGQHVPPCCAGL